jgi:hypothetical protein
VLEERTSLQVFRDCYTTFLCPRVKTGRHHPGRGRLQRGAPAKVAKKTVTGKSGERIGERSGRHSEGTSDQCRAVHCPWEPWNVEWITRGPHPFQSPSLRSKTVTINGTTIIIYHETRIVTTSTDRLEERLRGQHRPDGEEFSAEKR